MTKLSPRETIDVKYQSYLFLAMRMAVLTYKVYRLLKDSDNPELKALSVEARKLTGRFNMECRDTQAHISKAA